MSHKDTSLNAWHVSGYPRTLPALPTDAAEHTREIAARETLSLQATAVIESALPDHMIRETFANAKDLWTKLKESYGVQGPTFVYTKMMEVINYKIPDVADPSGHIAQLAAIFSQLNSAGATMHESIQAMMLLNAMPHCLETVTSMILAAAKRVANLKFEDARDAIVAAWRNPHTVANAACFRQQGQQKPQWNKNVPNQASGSKPQGNPQQKQGQWQQQKPANPGPSGQNQNDGEKKKRKHTHGKGKGKAGIAQIKEVPADYNAASAIAFPMAAEVLAPTTCSLVQRIWEGKVENMTMGSNPISAPTGAFSPFPIAENPDDIIVHLLSDESIHSVGSDDRWYEWSNRINAWRFNVIGMSSPSPSIGTSVDPSLDGMWLPFDPMNGPHTSWLINSSEFAFNQRAPSDILSGPPGLT
jgi:hypothetical protein